MLSGATSIDKYLRTEGISRWAQELHTYEEHDEGIANLKRYNNTADYIVAHSCDEKAFWYPPLRERSIKMETFPENRMLLLFEDTARYGHWNFGHYHMDGDLTVNEPCSSMN